MKSLDIRLRRSKAERAFAGMTIWKMALKALDIRLRRSKAEPAFAGMTILKMTLKSLGSRIRGNEILEDAAKAAHPPHRADTDS
ncbi:hypothetical protein [Lysobacter sp. Root690]|uniref:hypothetical protein n=1 Tax=Lysobacter sp. Root690 TaxID=1736588 RepID=UPI0012F9C146|nr:hypothetical protein [Lysobacter sp. Root690]